MTSGADSSTPGLRPSARNDEMRTVEGSVQPRWISARGGGAFGGELLRRRLARRAGLEPLQSVQPLDVDREHLFRRAGEDAGELRVPPDLVPPVRGARRDAGGESLLV